MKSLTSRATRIALSIACVLIFGAPAKNVLAFSNDNALRNLEQSYAYFDINTGNPKKLILRLKLLYQTVASIRTEGVNITAIVGFRGDASRFVTKDDHYVLQEESADKMEVRQWITRLAQEGVRLEQCSIAAKLLEIEFDDFLPELTLVDNGYISLIGYQNQGYAIVPMD